MRKLRPPLLTKEVTATMRAATPHRRAVVEAHESATRLRGEVEDPTVELSPEELAERRNEIHRLEDEARRQEEAVHRLTAKLQTRLPGWIKITK